MDLTYPKQASRKNLGTKQVSSRPEAVLGVLLGSVLLLALAGNARAQREARLATTETTRHYAFLIGVSEYDHLHNLRYTVDDVDRLEETLKKHGNFDAVYKLRDADNTDAHELKHHLEDFFNGNVNRGFARLTARDRVVVFFSGHGAKPNNGQSLYLCPKNYDTNNPETTGLSITWLREKLTQCKATTKVLIVDSCHAGSEKGSPSAAELTKMEFANPPGPGLPMPFKNVVTLASCGSNQASYMSDGLKHSIFTYHIIEGLKGHADRDLDGSVDIDELYAYVHERVDRDVRRLHGRTQTPVRIIGPGTSGVPIITDVHPMSLDELLGDMAERIAYELHAQQDKEVTTILPLEFAVQTKELNSLVLKLDSGSLGKYCSDTICTKLQMASNRIGDPIKMATEASKSSLNLDTSKVLNLPDLDRERMRGNSLLYTVGTIRTRIGHPVQRETEIVLSCEVRSPDEHRPIAKATGKALLSLEESAMSGWSARVDEGHAAEHADLLPVEANRVDWRHPFQQDAKFPYPVGLRVGKKFRPGKFVGNRLYVPVNKGEEYEIHIRCYDEKPVMMRLLVDGLNTLPQRIIVNGQKEYVAAPRTNLAHARPWLLDPTVATDFAVIGFVSETGENGGGKVFRLTDRESAWAARTQYTDQIGIITAAFYQTDPNVPKEILGTLGTIPGRDFYQSLRERKDLSLGPEIAFVTLHYVDTEVWERIPADEDHYMQ